MTDFERCAQFHGHVCGGLMIGYKAALYARKLLELDSSEDERIVCIAENDACGIDAIQVMLGCTVGKGNLLFHIRGKQAFSFYDRGTGRSVRLVLRSRPAGMEKNRSLEYYREREPEQLFDVKPAVIPLPEKARIFFSYVCDRCGETTGANWIRLSGEEKLCLDCWEEYDRFRI